ncbi:hypothetical protein [Paraburkholderia hospita]|uniref:hypothetical protein n=1 Tax=Paraburkholderia TaxID=1822464 RepID=UPI000B345BF5|nr:hypothetical protein [Paraburkholderia hospita]OUL73501.1 hypothetical protein CA601_43800 [Paraburkholderia hospita]
MQRRTVVALAHWLSTLQKFDRNAVILHVQPSRMTGRTNPHAIQISTRDVPLRHFVTSVASRGH